MMSIIVLVRQRNSFRCFSAYQARNYKCFPCHDYIALHLPGKRSFALEELPLRFLKEEDGDKKKSIADG